MRDPKTDPLAGDEIIGRVNVYFVTDCDGDFVSYDWLTIAQHRAERWHHKRSNRVHVKLWRWIFGESTPSQPAKEGER